MASYCQEKYEDPTAGTEVIVYWVQNKHVHDASMISKIAARLGEVHGGVWSVRASSYQSNQSSPPVNGVDLKELFPGGRLD